MRCISRGEGIRTPGPMLPKHVRYQTALHPGIFRLLRVNPQATLVMIHGNERFVKWFFNIFFKAVFSPHLAHTMHQHEEVKAHG